MRIQRVAANLRSVRHRRAYIRHRAERDAAIILSILDNVIP